MVDYKHRRDVIAAKGVRPPVIFGPPPAHATNVCLRPIAVIGRARQNAPDPPSERNLMSLPTFLVPTFTQMLKALSGWLEKAQAQMPEKDAQALLLARLAPDMFPLSTQVRFACVQVQEAMNRLQGLPFSPAIAELLDEGRKASERPGSLVDAQARIAETITLLEALPADALNMAPESPIAHELPNGMIFDFTAEQYARDWALAQFYFHVMTAYAILRSEGVDLGKVDYIPHLIPNVRPAAQPQT